MMEKKSQQKKVTVSEIKKADLKEVSIFLHNHMNKLFSPQVWESGINKSWADNTPNYGFSLSDNGHIVGVLCAIYSDQYIGGELKKFCNPHSWCVLPEYRTRSVDLVLSAIRQTGYHFTMFSPNESGVEIFGYLKFKRLDTTTSIILNMPVLNLSGVQIVGNSEDMAGLLTYPYNKYYEDHKIFPWLKRMVFGKKSRYGFILYKKQYLKRLPCAAILYVSDANLFEECWPVIRTNLLLTQGMITSKVERRFLSHPLSYTLKNESVGRKFFLSKDITEENIQYIYSELITLDI